MNQVLRLETRVSADLVETDADGFLLNHEDWSPALARAMAEADGLTLTEEHWQVIDFLHEFYQTFELAPALACLVKHMREKLGDETWSKSRLRRLFANRPAPYEAALQACRYAGLPRPSSGYCG